MSNQKYLSSINKAVANSAHFYFVCLDLSGNYTFVNQHFATEYDFQATGIIGSPFTHTNHKEDIEKCHETICECVLCPEKVFSLQLRKMDIDGDFHYVDWEFSGITDEYEDVIGVQAVGYDVSEAVQAKLELERLKHATLNFDTIIFNTNDVYVCLDVGMNIVSFNQKARDKVKKITGKNLQIGDNFLPYDQDRGRFIEYFTEALEGSYVCQEHETTLLTGEKMWYERRYYPIYDKKNTRIGVAFNSIDITQRKKNELQIVKQNQQLREIAHLQSHLVRRPVANLLGILEIMATDELSAENNQLIQLLKQSVSELDQVIHAVVGKANENFYQPMMMVSENEFQLGKSAQTVRLAS